MRRPSRAAAHAAAALLVLALAAGPAQAQVLGSPGQLIVPANQAALYAQIINAVTGVSVAVNQNKTLSDPDVVAAAAAVPPPNASPKAVAAAIGAVAAAALVQAEAKIPSLGDPRAFKYPDGKRVALFRFPVGQKAKGTCIFVHGCKHDPYSWFYKSDKCPQCTGLPEEVSHTKQCLARGYAVLALMSKNREYRNRCFSSSGDPEKSDQADTGQLIRLWTKKYGLDRKPKWLFGISSGASFAIKFPKTMYVDGIISEVNQPWKEAWGVTDKNDKLTVKFPPTVWYMMERDTQTAAQIRQGVRILRKNKVPADYVFVPPRAVNKGFLAQRSIFISPAQAAQIYSALKKIGVLDANGFVRYDVRFNIKWTAQLPKILPWLKRSSPYYNLISDESQIWQELNLAWSRHEIISDFVRPTLMWLEKKGKANLTDLVERYATGNRISCLTERKEGC